MDIDTMLRAYAMNLAYAKELAADVPVADETKIPAPGLENHPVFVLGHLCTGSALLAKSLGSDGELPEGWVDMFQRGGPVDERLPDQQLKWPALGDVVAELTRLHVVVDNSVRGFPNDRWEEPCEWRLAKHLPTLGDLTWFMCVTHEAVHLGQVACWRRAMGLPSALARL